MICMGFFLLLGLVDSNGYVLNGFGLKKCSEMGGDATWIIYRECEWTKYAVQRLNGLMDLGLDHFLSSVYWGFTIQLGCLQAWAWRQSSIDFQPAKSSKTLK